MAGGEGAKERRRLKRLAVQEAKKKSEIIPQQTEVKDVKDGRNNKKPSNFSATKGRILKSKNNGKKVKKPKFKKPKHLKRKLEQASNENGEAKEVIKREIEQFEAKKVLYSKHRKSNKRQKIVNDDSGNDDKAVSRLNKINHNPSPSPRGEKFEKKEPAMDESDNSEMRSQEETIEQKGAHKDEPSVSKSESGESSTQDSSDDESMDENTDENRGKRSGKSTEGDEGNSSDDPSSDSDHDDSDDDVDDDEPVQKRQRGRRRRGRQDTAEKIAEMKAAEIETAAKIGTLDASNNKPEDKHQDDSANKGTKRYCIGRKPVTDFVIGQSYTAKVVYVKPFGVFFDIGCHSDAFCHVSRLSDDYIESPESKFKEGDEVSKVRVVEIDRKQKRITVSLQSEARIEDERHSIEARKSRKEKRGKKSKKKTIDYSSSVRSENFTSARAATAVSNEPAVIKSAPAKKNVDPSAMTPAELKRARKLARRAERRAQAEQQQQPQQ